MSEEKAGQLATEAESELLAMLKDAQSLLEHAHRWQELVNEMSHALPFSNNPLVNRAVLGQTYLIPWVNGIETTVKRSIDTMRETHPQLLQDGEK